MKKIKIIALILVMTLTVGILSGCGGLTGDIEKDIIGEWGYDYYASLVGEDCHKIYTFHEDGTYESEWINDDSPSKNSYGEGEYVIEGNEIYLYEDGSYDGKIVYEYDDDELELTEVSSDGTAVHKVEEL